MKPKIDLEVGLEFSPQIFIISSKDHADQVKTIHYISNKELSKLAITPVSYTHLRAHET